MKFYFIERNGELDYESDSLPRFCDNEKIKLHVFIVYSISDLIKLLKQSNIYSDILKQIEYEGNIFSDSTSLQNIFVTIVASCRASDNFKIRYIQSGFVKDYNPSEIIYHKLPRTLPFLQELVLTKSKKLIPNQTTSVSQFSFHPLFDRNTIPIIDSFVGKEE